MEKYTFNPNLGKHTVNNFRWLFVDDSHGVYTYNIQAKADFLFFKIWKTIKSIESEDHEKAFNLCEDILEILNIQI